MSLSQTPSSERTRIGLFGRRNAGKSSLINALTAQEIAIVSEKPGTTTDTVQKAMELLPLGPVLFLDTPGLDDEGELGEKRVKAARRALSDCDVALVIVDAALPLSETEEEILKTAKDRGIPALLVFNKCDKATPRNFPDGAIAVSAKTGEGIHKLKEAIATLSRENESEKCLIKDLIGAGDVVVLVTPIDASAPKGRIILPQQQTLRELLDAHAIPVFCQPEELKQTLAALKKAPRLVITDSQAFFAVANDLTDDIPLTSFSILFARYKGDLKVLVDAVRVLTSLPEHAKVLISEGCTHHRQCGDIGTTKIPAAIRKIAQKDIDVSFTSGKEFPDTLTDYDLVVHCGACMLTEGEMKARQGIAASCGVPMTNYGIVLALASGILPRAVRPFGLEL